MTDAVKIIKLMISRVAQSWDSCGDKKAKFTGGQGVNNAKTGGGGQCHGGRGSQCIKSNGGMIQYTLSAGFQVCDTHPKGQGLVYVLCHA